MATFETVLGLIAFCVFLAIIAQRTKLPVAVPLVLGGMGLAMIPGLPSVKLDPELALALFLPPLLQISAYHTDWPAFKSNLRSILLLAIGAVLFTAISVALVAHWLLPSLPWWAAFALGAIVAPPDAVAAGSVLKQFKLPQRIITVLEGESLINDASALVLYRFAVAAVTAGTVSYFTGLLQFFAMATGGMLVGWITSRAAMWVFTKINDTMLDIVVSILAGFVAYLAAEAVHASGVLGAVVCGMVLGRRQHAKFTAQTRLELNSVWKFIEFLLASLIFMLIGLQMREILERLADQRSNELIWLGVLAFAVSITLIASRFAWIFLTNGLTQMLTAKANTGSRASWAHQLVVSWAGMRGVVSLAAALALPADFPQRDVIVLLAFCAIFVTLILQGTTLGWIVKKFSTFESEELYRKSEEAKTRAGIADAAFEKVKSHLNPNVASEHSDAAIALVDEYETRAQRANFEENTSQQTPEQLDAERRLRLIAIEASRKKMAQYTDQVDIDTHRKIVEELDLEEQKIRSAMKKDK